MNLISGGCEYGPLGVIPILVGPLQALIALLPIILVALGSVVASIALAIFRPKKLLGVIWSQRIAIIIIGLIVGGYITASKYGLLGGTHGGPVAAANFTGKWPVYRGGPDRSGSLFDKDKDDPRSGGVQWQKKENWFSQIVSSPSAIGNRIYVTTTKVGVYGTDGAITCVDSETGKTVWQYDDGYRATFSSPSIKDNYLVVGEGLHKCTDARVFCMDVQKSETDPKGVKVWEYRTKSHVESSPAIGEGKTVVGAGDDGMYCFDIKGDGNGGPKVLWHLYGKKYLDCESSPIIHEGRVYFGLGNEGQAIVCVDAADGKEIWRKDTPYPVFGAPAISDGKLIVGMGNGDMINTAEDLQAALRKKLEEEKKTPAEIEEAVKKIAPGGAVWCLDLTTGKEIWTFPVPKTILGAVAVTDGKIYVGCQDGVLYCLNMEGKEVDKWNSHSPIITSPAVGKNTVYVVTQSGTLYGLDLATFKPVWEVELDKSVISSPIVADGHIYTGTENNGLLCVGSSGMAKTKPLWAGYMGGPGRSGWADGVMLDETGKFLWRFPKPQGTASAGQVVVPPAVIDDNMYVATGGNSPGLSKLLLSEKAPADKPAWSCPSKNPVVISPAATEQFAYFVDGKAGDNDRLLRCVNASDGLVAWSVPVSGEASGLFGIVGNHLMIFDKPGQLSCLALGVTDDKSRWLWSMPVASDKNVPIAIGQVLYVADGENLSAIDLPSGQPLWKRALPSPAVGGMVVADDHIWVPCSDSVYCLDPFDGKSLGSVHTGIPGSRLVVSGTRLILVNNKGQIVIINPKKIAEESRLSGATVGLDPAVSGDNLLYFAGQSIMRFQIPAEAKVATSSPTTASSAPAKAAAPTEWMKLLSSMGNPMSPPIVYKSQVFFAAEKIGLVSAGSRK